MRPGPPGRHYCGSSQFPQLVLEDGTPRPPYFHSSKERLWKHNASTVPKKDCGKTKILVESHAVCFYSLKERRWNGVILTVSPGRWEGRADAFHSPVLGDGEGGQTLSTIRSPREGRSEMHDLPRGTKRHTSGSEANAPAATDGGAERHGRAQSNAPKGPIRTTQFHRNRARARGPGGPGRGPRPAPWAPGSGPRPRAPGPKPQTTGCGPRAPGPGPRAPRPKRYGSGAPGPGSFFPERAHSMLVCVK